MKMKRGIPRALPSLAFPYPWPLNLAKAKIDMTSEPSPLENAQHQALEPHQSSKVTSRKVRYQELHAVRPRFVVLLVPLTQGIEIREQLKIAIADAPAPSASERFLSLL
jgi:hypothetical protein